MFRHSLNENVQFKTYIDWFTLSFMAGNMNAGGYLACRQFVSHVTGFATLAGISFEKNLTTEALALLSIPLFFLIGVMISGFLHERSQSSAKKINYALTMGISTLLIAVVVVGGSLGWFGRFGEPSEIKNDFLLLACLCCASGLQNGAISLASNYSIRTTHLTGTTTDLGLGLIKSIRSKTNHRMNTLRLATIVSFIFGSFTAAFIYSQFKYLGFLVPMTISLYYTVVEIINSKNSCKPARESQ